MYRSLLKTGTTQFLNIWQNSTVKLSGPRFFNVGRVQNMNLVSLILVGLFKFFFEFFSHQLLLGGSFQILLCCSFKHLFLDSGHEEQQPEHCMSLCCLQWGKEETHRPQSDFMTFAWSIAPCLSSPVLNISYAPNQVVIKGPKTIF